MYHDFRDVGLFHQKFNLDNVIFRGWGPRGVSPELYDFRIKFLQEELDEFKAAVESKDIEKQADALIDLVYVALGTAHLLGLPWETLWAEVHRANMEKVRAQKAEESSRNSAFDVVKPAGWKPPALKKILKGLGWNV